MHIHPHKPTHILMNMNTVYAWFTLGTFVKQSQKSCCSLWHQPNQALLKQLFSCSLSASQ